MADYFKDEETKKRVLNATSTPAAEEAMKEIKGFNEGEWNKVL